MSKKKSELVPELRFPEFAKDGEWNEKTLGEVCDITNGKANAQDHVENGIYPLFDRSEVIKASNDFIFDCETVIIPGEGMRFIPKYYKGKFNLHQRAYALKDFTCNGQFVYYSMLHRSALLSKKAVQSTVLSLRLPILQDFSIVIPKNPKEQQTIAFGLSSLDEVIGAHSQKLVLLKEHKKGLMQNLFPQEGEKVPKYRFKEFEKDKVWLELVLDDAVKFTSGGTPSKEIEEYWNGNIPWISASSMYDLVAEKSDLKISDLAIRDGASLTKKGNLLILVRGSMLFKRIPICVAGRDVSFNQDVKALELKKEIDTFFFLYLLISKESALLDSVTSTGIGAGKLDTDGLKKLPLKVPSNKKEQQKIASCLSSIHELIAAETQKIDQLKLHKKGLMQGLFPTMND